MWHFILLTKCNGSTNGTGIILKFSGDNGSLSLDKHPPLINFLAHTTTEYE